MEPRIYPFWEPRPLQELNSGVRHAVEAVRQEALPQDALGRALERAGQLPATTPSLPRPWFRPRLGLAAVSVAASLLVTVGLWAVLSAPGEGTADARRREGDHSIHSDTVKGVTYEERERLMANGLGTPLDININAVEGQGTRSAHAQHPLLNRSRHADAAYERLREFLLDEKRLPPPGAVRVDELINAFPYRYASPKGEHPLALTLHLIECPWDRKHQLLCIGLKSRVGDVESVARDVKVQLDCNPRRVAAYRLLGDENAALRFEDDRQPGVSLRADHTATALYEIVPAELALPTSSTEPLKYQQPAQTTTLAEGTWLAVRVRYKNLDADAGKLLVQPLTKPAAPWSTAPVDCRFAAAVAWFGLLLKAGESAPPAWADLRELARTALAQDLEGRRAEFLDLVDTAAYLACKDKKD